MHKLLEIKKNITMEWKKLEQRIYANLALIATICWLLSKWVDPYFPFILYCAYAVFTSHRSRKMHKES